MFKLEESKIKIVKYKELKIKIVKNKKGWK